MKQPINILLVEDNPVDVLFITEALRGSSYKEAALFVAESLSDAKKFSEENIHLLLLDLKLPDSCGLNTVQQILKYFPDSILIILTHLDDEKVAVEALREGAQNYLNKKEINSKVLERTIRFSLERNQIIQKLKIADKELIQNKTFLEKAQEVAHMGSWVVDVTHDTGELSDEAQKIFGFKPGEFDGKIGTFFSIIHPEDFPLLKKEIEVSIEKKRLFEITYRINRRDGITRWIHSQAEIVFDAKGGAPKMIGSVQDITGIREAEEKINKITRLYAFISQVNQNIVRVKDEETLFQNACRIAIEFGKFEMAWVGIFNKTGTKISAIEQNGIPENKAALFNDAPVLAGGPQDYVLRTGKQYLVNDIRSDMGMVNWKPLAIGHGIYSCMVLPVKKSGNTIGTFNLYSTEPAFFDEEEIKLLVEVAGDISFALDMFEKARQHKKAEEEMKLSERRFHSLFDNMLEAFAYCKMIYENGIPDDFIYIEVNDAFYKLTGLKNVEGKKVTGVIPGIKKDNPELFEAYGRVALTGNSERFEIYLKSLEMWLDISVYSNEKGNFIAVFDVITDRKRAEIKEEFDRNNLNALINNTNDLMWSVDKDFNLITFNQPFDDIIRAMSGKGLIKGNNILSVSFSPQQLTRYAKFYERAFAGEVFTEIEYNASPAEFWSEISFYPIRKGDEIIGTACHSRDITASRHADLERTRIMNDLTLRNKELEQFSFIVSHNLRAPVANIIGLADIAQYEDLGMSQRKEVMKGLSLSVGKLDEVIIDLNDILRVKGEVKSKKEMVRFSQVANDIHSSIQNIIEKEKVVLFWDFSEADEMLTLKSYLHSIFYNLISNSIKYHQPGIAPVIEIKSSKLNNVVELVFKDNGMGIDLVKKGDQVFGLYKRFHAEMADGKGMGLYMVRTQVEALGGKISIESEVNKGTTFRIEFET